LTCPLSSVAVEACEPSESYSVNGVPITTGDKTWLGRITKMGDRYLRKLLVVGARATLRHRQGHSDAMRLWASGMIERKTVKYKFNLTAVALANKVARIVFAE
jgi:transposase